MLVPFFLVLLAPVVLAAFAGTIVHLLTREPGWVREELERGWTMTPEAEQRLHDAIQRGRTVEGWVQDAETGRYFYVWGNR